MAGLHQWSHRTSRLFKLEFERITGHHPMQQILLRGQWIRSKEQSLRQEMCKEHNDITWWCYVSTIKGRNDHTQNGGFQVVAGCMKTYVQDKLGLSANYDKLRALPDDIHRTYFRLDKISSKRYLISSTTHPLRSHFKKWGWS